MEGGQPPPILGFKICAEVKIQFILRGRRNSVKLSEQAYCKKPEVCSEAFSEENIKNWLAKDK